MLKETWDIIEKNDTTYLKTVVLLWDSMFQQDVKIKRYFFFISDRDDWRDSEESKKVAMMAGTFFKGMVGDFAGYTPKIIKLGYRHVFYKVGNSELDPVFTNSFFRLSTIVMGDKFTPPVQQSWTVACKLLYYLMATGADYHH